MKPYVVTITLNPALDKTVTINKLNHGGLNRASSIRIDAGGKGINVAKVLKGFSVNTIASGLISGVHGQTLLELLSRERIEARFLNVQGDTRVNMKIIEEGANVTTEINEMGFCVDDKDLELFQHKLSELLYSASFLVLSGSLPRGVREEIYSSYIKLAAGRGVKTILDADGAALQKGIESSPYAVKPNLCELERLFGRKMANDNDIVSAGRNLLKKGVKIVAVSMGEKGAILMNDDEALRIRTFPVVTASTVAAGDSMVAAMVFSFLNGYSLKQTAKWITAAGTITVSKPGTQVCSLEEVRKSLELVEVRQLPF